MNTNMLQDVLSTAESPQAHVAHVFWRAAVSHFNVAPKGRTSRECQAALFADKFVESATVLLRQEMRMGVNQVVNEAGQSRELQSAAIARLLATVPM